MSVCFALEVIEGVSGCSLNFVGTVRNRISVTLRSLYNIKTDAIPMQAVSHSDPEVARIAALFYVLRCVQRATDRNYVAHLTKILH